MDSQWFWLLFLFCFIPLWAGYSEAIPFCVGADSTLLVLLQRLLITASAFVIILAIARWSFNPSDSVWLVHRRVQFVWMLFLTGWASLVRLALRRGLLLPESPRLCLLVEPHEINSVLTAWCRVPHSQHFSSVDPLHLQRYLELQEQPLLVAVSPHFRRNSSHRTLLESLELLDPRSVRTVSVLSLFEQQQERLPPV